MTLSELRATLAGLEVAQRTGITRDWYADLFPPGEQDKASRASCNEFAKAAGCLVEVSSERHSIWFVKVTKTSEIE